MQKFCVLYIFFLRIRLYENTLNIETKSKIQVWDIQEATFIKWIFLCLFYFSRRFSHTFKSLQYYINNLDLHYSLRGHFHSNLEVNP